jgi:hypothetical protein
MAIIVIDNFPLGAATDGSEEYAAWQGSGTVKILGREIKKFQRAVNISAAGTDQAGATALSNNFHFHVVSVVGSGAGTKFLALLGGTNSEIRIIHVAAGAANNLLHYPPSGGTINEQAANVAVIIPKGTTQIFISTSTVDWVTIP